VDTKQKCNITKVDIQSIIVNDISSIYVLGFDPQTLAGNWVLIGSLT
jgi:hypothetical protein